MKKSIFISRRLKPESVFLKELSKEGYQVFGESLIEFEPIDFNDFPITDWIFFYSQNAVDFFEKGLSNDNKKEIFEKTKIAAIGESTSKLAKKAFQKIDFISDGNPQNTAQSFLKLAQNQTVLFPRALKSRQSIQKILSGKIQDIDLVVYKNQLRENINLPNFDVLVFTSPMNVEAYFLDRQLVDNQLVVSIGETTTKALKKMNCDEIFTSLKPTELELVRTVKSLYSSSF